MRRPTIKNHFGIEDSQAGLSSFLASMTTLDNAISPTDQSSLFVVFGGPTPPNPTALLASPAMEELVSYLGRQAQLTLIDAPPVLGLADVSILAPRVDATLLVVNQDVSRREHVREALKQLEAIQSEILGVVFLRKNGNAWYY